MTSRDFAYWLQGFFEITDANSIQPPAMSLAPDQVTMIKRHLAMVFIHDIDPSMGGPEQQEKLNEAHSGTPPRPELPSRPPFSHDTTIYRC